ncbi:MAG TPA: hypothetical protein ENJ42_03010 [Hellea balneolensis]|uniref:HNH domain-containing protein n=1 Tax=Hellea balneolensis TaxID=287478 RepID=A0A7C5R7R9_9PROT|nr:hypothetical protein [Hellea balneolensis]
MTFEEFLEKRAELRDHPESEWVGCVKNQINDLVIIKQDDGYEIIRLRYLAHHLETGEYCRRAVGKGQKYNELTKCLQEAGFRKVERAANTETDEFVIYRDFYLALPTNDSSNFSSRIAKKMTFWRRDISSLIPEASDHVPAGKEGAVIQATSNQYERKPEYRQACVEYFEGKDGRIACQVCDMDFESRYGEIGRGFIHIHHIDPLGDGQGEREIVPTRDLVPVCPNCHAMLHKKPGIGNAYTLEEIRQRLKE